MRLAITGGAGCLGSNLVERYVPEGVEVLVIDNFATGKREVLPDVSGLQAREGSVADAAFVDSCFQEFRPTHVIHSAAAYKDPGDWEEDAATNVSGTINTLVSAARCQVERFVYFQTALCYGRPETVPIPVDHPARPFTSYGISKTAGESYVALSDLSWVSLRLANVTGPRLAIGPIPAFYKRLKAGQPCFCTRSVRDFLDMRDFLSIVDRVLEPGCPGGIFNVSTGEGHSIKEILDLVASHLDIKLEPPVSESPPGADDIAEVVLDPGHTQEVLGWRAQVEFEETIRNMLSWYDHHGISDVYSHLRQSQG